MKHIILGAGGTGKTIAGMIETQLSNIYFLDDKLEGRKINGFEVLGRIKDISNFKNDKFIVGFGSTYLKQRIKLFKDMKEKEFKFFNAIHKDIFLDRTAQLGNGIFIAAKCIINPNVKIGDNSIICVSSTIDHDSILGKQVYISPGVNISGGAIIEDNVFIGTNATILPCIKIGENAIIGAGTVVINNIPPNVTVVGVPGKVIKKNK